MQYHDFERGVAQWRHVLDLGSDSDKALYFWLMSLYETGERAKALRLAISIATSRQVPQVLRLLANDARIQGNADAAIRWHRKIVDLDPQTLRNWLELAQLYKESEDLDTCAATLREAQTHHLSELTLQLSLARDTGRKPAAPTRRSGQIAISDRKTLGPDRASVYTCAS